MFFGTTPSIISQWVLSELKSKSPKRVFEPFAGNFVVSQITGILSKEIEVHSTDVSLYSCGIGFGVLDIPKIHYGESEILDRFSFFKTKESPLDIACGILFFSEVAKNLSKEHIGYYKSLNQDAEQNQEKYYEQIHKKLTSFKNTLGEFKFYGTCGVRLLEETKGGDFVFFDPPVILGDYEKMFAPLKQIFSWEEPSYTEMTDAIKFDALESLSEKGCNVYYRTNEEIEPPKGYEMVFRHQYKRDGFYCVYSNKQPKSIFSNCYIPLREKPINLEIIDISDVISEKSVIEVVKTTSLIANHYRLMWVKKAEMTNMGVPYLVFCDKKLIGLYQISDGSKLNNEFSLIVSDPCAPTSQ